MKLCDTHCHIYMDDFKDDFLELINQIENELEFIVSISCDMETTLQSFELTQKYPFIYSTVGYHPVDIKKYNEKDYLKMLDLAKKNEKIVAIGEIGLDYHWMEDDKETQKNFFEMQIKDAIKLDMPIVIHTRDALQDTIDILHKYKNAHGILHCYPGSFEMCKDLLDRFYIGIGGTLTFKNNVKTKKLIEQLPLENIVIETDSPYLTPVPFRGKRNNPTYTKYVAYEISKIKGISLDEVIRVTTLNAKKIYNIK